MTGGDNEMITVKQAAEILGITENGVLAAINRGAIEASKFGSVWSIPKKNVIEYRDNRAPTGPRRGEA